MSEDHQEPAETIRRTPSNKSAKVARLRQEIATGEYQVDPDAIADRLVEQGFPGDVNPS